MNRPRVIVNMAPSLDGKLAPARPREPGETWVMSRHAEDPRRMRALRASADAVLVGAANLRLDDPDLAPAKLRVVITRAGDGVLPGAKVFDPAPGGESVVAHAATMSETKRRELTPHATLVEMGETEVAPLRLLAWLHEARGCRTVVCEGGGVVVASFFAARAVDELRLTIVPRVLGGTLAPSVVGGAGFDPDEVSDARLASVERVGDELYLVYVWDAVT